MSCVCLTMTQLNSKTRLKMTCVSIIKLEITISLLSSEIITRQFLCVSFAAIIDLWKPTSQILRKQICILTTISGSSSIAKTGPHLDTYNRHSYAVYLMRPLYRTEPHWNSLKYLFVRHLMKYPEMRGQNPRPAGHHLLEFCPPPPWPARYCLLRTTFVSAPAAAAVSFRTFWSMLNCALFSGGRKKDPLGWTVLRLRGYWVRLPTDGNGIGLSAEVWAAMPLKQIEIKINFDCFRKTVFFARLFFYDFTSNVHSYGSVRWNFKKWKKKKCYYGYLFKLIGMQS